MSGRGLYPLHFCSMAVLCTTNIDFCLLPIWRHKLGGRDLQFSFTFFKGNCETKKWIEGTISILDSICSVRVFHLYWQFNRKWQKINWFFLPDLLSCIRPPTKEAWESSEDAVAGWAQIWAQFTPPPLKVGHKNVWSNVSKVTSP